MSEEVIARVEIKIIDDGKATKAFERDVHMKSGLVEDFVAEIEERLDKITIKRFQSDKERFY